MREFIRQGVNFTNISALRSFSLVTVWLDFFGPKNISAKAACKMLLKLIKGVNYTKILQVAFSRKYPKCSKRQSSHMCFFAHLGSACIKTASKTLMKLTLGFGFCQEPLLSFLTPFFNHRSWFLIHSTILPLIK